jgi:hypothetical protein
MKRFLVFAVFAASMSTLAQTKPTLTLVSVDHGVYTFQYDHTVLRTRCDYTRFEHYPSKRHDHVCAMTTKLGDRIPSFNLTTDHLAVFDGADTTYFFNIVSWRKPRALGE